MGNLDPERDGDEHPRPIRGARIVGLDSVDRGSMNPRSARELPDRQPPLAADTTKVVPAKENGQGDEARGRDRRLRHHPKYRRMRLVLYARPRPGSSVRVSCASVRVSLRRI